MPAHRTFIHTPGVLIEVNGVSLSNSPYVVCVDGPLADGWARVLKRAGYQRYTMGPDPRQSERFRKWCRQLKDNRT
jgi:hypothetical protein